MQNCVGRADRDDKAEKANWADRVDRDQTFKKELKTETEFFDALAFPGLGLVSEQLFIADLLDQVLEMLAHLKTSVMRRFRTRDVTE